MDSYTQPEHLQQWLNGLEGPSPSRTLTPQLQDTRPTQYMPTPEMSHTNSPQHMNYPAEYSTQGLVSRLRLLGSTQYTHPSERPEDRRPQLDLHFPQAPHHTQAPEHRYDQTSLPDLRYPRSNHYTDSPQENNYKEVVPRDLQSTPYAHSHGQRDEQASQYGLPYSYPTYGGQELESALPYPQLLPQPPLRVNQTIQAFPDFLTPNPAASVSIVGSPAALDSLAELVHYGGLAQHHRQNDMLQAYRALETAIGGLCRRLGIPACSATELAKLHRHDDFEIAANTWCNILGYREEHYSEVFPTNTVNEHVMAVLLIMFADMQQHRSMTCHLGLIYIRPGKQLPEARILGPALTNASQVAWIAVDFRPQIWTYRGIGYLAPPVPTRHIKRESPFTPAVDRTPISPPATRGIKRPLSDAETPTRAGKRPHRETAATVKQLQIPLPAHLTHTDILNHYPERLHYLNMLKVALHYSNNDIFKIASRLPSHLSRLRAASAVTKRIGVGCEWVEKKLGIPEGMLRHRFDAVRRDNNIGIRPKHARYTEAEMQAEDEKLDAALQWISTGGDLSPRVAAGLGVDTAESEDDAGVGHAPWAAPYTAPAPAPYPTPSGGPSVFDSPSPVFRSGVGSPVLDALAAVAPVGNVEHQGPVPSTRAEPQAPVEEAELWGYEDMWADIDPALMG